MHHSKFVVLLVFSTLVTVAGPSALADGGYEHCTVGDRVQYRDGRSGIVTGLGFGGDDTSCMVLFDGEGDSHMYPANLLRPAGSSTAGRNTASVAPGRYACYGGVPPQYEDYDIVVQSSTGYSDDRGNAGRYTYDASSQILTFRSGPFAGEYGLYRTAREIGLSAGPITSQTYFTTFCDFAD